jgi:hypothetical protein
MRDKLNNYFVFSRQTILKVKQERETAEQEKKKLEERLLQFEEDARKAQEGVLIFS